MHKEKFNYIVLFIIINIIIFLIEYANSTVRDTNYLLSIGGYIWGESNLIETVFRSFTCQFIHSGFIHLLINMINLYFISNELKKYQSSSETLVIYLLGVVGVSIGLLIFARSEIVYVGNSGAIYCLLGSWLYSNYKCDSEEKYLKKNMGLIIFLLIFNLIPGISIIMHLSGFIIGVTSTFLLLKFKKLESLM